MSNGGLSFILSLLLATSILVLAYQAKLAETESVTITVPDDYPTIQEAINAANPQDAVFVKAGTYYEHVVVNKTVMLIGENMESTTIDGNTTTSGTAITITADNVTVSGFRIQRADYNIAVLNCAGVNIYQNKLGSGHYKIHIENSGSCNVEGNEIVGGWKGITLMKSNNNKIAYNTMSFCNSYTFPIGPFYGLSLENSTMNYVESNTILTCDIGIGLSESTGNLIRNNKISGDWPTSSGAYNAKWGLVLTSGSDGNIIVANTISNMTDTAIRLSLSNSNVIYHNSFMNNTDQVDLLDPLSNTWDDGFPSGGNYWSDYEVRYPSALEIDDSGIWNTPYVIDANNQDDYPLILRLGSIPGDVNSDGYVGIIDIFLIASRFGREIGEPGYFRVFDINGDGYIGIDDLLIAASHFGEEEP